MADLIKLTVRGHYNSCATAVNLWVRRVAPPIVVSESGQAEALCAAAAVSWLDNVNPVLSTAALTEKFIAEGFDVPECYFELNTAMSGSVAGEVCPQFVAQGYRQFRTNSDFRVATHRVPSVREINNSGGSWLYDSEITAIKTAAAAGFFANPLTATIGLVEYTFQPVLIRTRYTPRGEASPVTTYFDPPQVSDVPSAAFYGITSQVSRKIISAS